MEEGGMKRLAGSTYVALATAALLASLSLVAWRQARALEALEALDNVRREQTLGLAELMELQGRVKVLESRGRVVPDARDRLGMRVPEAAEIVILAAGQGEAVR
jgi:cell division protein FtsL